MSKFQVLNSNGVGCIKHSSHVNLKNLKKNDTYSPFIFFFICNIFYTTTAFFWAITFENPSINDEMAAIWNFPENVQRAITSKKNEKHVFSDKLLEEYHGIALISEKVQ